MIKIYSLLNVLKKNSIDFFTGVPDSILKELSLYLAKLKKNKHIIAVNEGSAISIAIGYYLAKKKIPCVYLQNSGLSNAINPLISIADSKVYSIPLVLLIGWRGSPKIKDEPQHNAKGKITRQILKLLKIKYTIIRQTKDLKKFENLIKFSKIKNIPVACLIENNTIEKNRKKIIHKKSYKNKIDKEFFLKKLLSFTDKDTRIICSTGYNSREIMHLRNKYNIKKGKDFYMVGAWGIHLLYLWVIRFLPTKKLFV
jgi:phosphonopyruvate decarboxylase|tara:strand:+ start:1387 stop:2151 length:765 start_codon:yes stop_codon:yes gene_type:complete